MKEKFKKNIQEDKTWWKSKTKKEKAGFILSIVFFVLIIGTFFLWVYCRDIFGDQVGDALLGEGVLTGWSKLGVTIGNHASAWVTTITTIALALGLIFVINFIIGLFTFTGKRSRTVGSLIKSLSRYIITLLAIAVILTVWGVDVASVVAGLGVLTLIVGLGCQSLIADVISGLFIVFDDYLDVGDIVNIGDFRGTVTEVGLRTTKLESGSGQIKCIANSSITTVINLSRKPSLVTVELDVGYNEDLERVEAILAEKTPELSKKIPALLSGPFYKGVNGFSDAGVTLLFVGTCRESDIYQVTRDLRREVYLLYVHNDIFVPYKQVVVNPQDPQDRPKATPEQLAATHQFIEEGRALPKANKKKRFFEKAEESLKAAEEDLK